VGDIRLDPLQFLMPNRTPTITRVHPAFAPPHGEGVRRRWWIVIAGLLLIAAVAVASRPVCRPDAAGTDESAFGVRHEKRGATWVHCEPWLRRVLTDWSAR
jgi:hypothetical protein